MNKFIEKFKNSIYFRAGVIAFSLLLFVGILVLVVFSFNKNSSNNVVILEKSAKENSDTANDLASKENSDSSFVENNNNCYENSKATEVDSVKPAISSTKNYINLYPDLCAQRPEKQIVLEKTIYLTFDDGPSERTVEILDILKKYNIKATFFVIGNASNLAKECMKRIVSEGHTIAVHTYTHNFKQIYSSVESYLDDINKIYNLIHEVTGVKPSIFRFAGGSKNGFNKNIYRELITEMRRRGFDYFDWNLCTGDAARRGLVPTSELLDNVLKNSSKYNTAVVLMHDSKPKITTVEALPKLIEGLKEQGFSFERLSNNIYPADFSLVKPYA